MSHTLLYAEELTNPDFGRSDINFIARLRPRQKTSLVLLSRCFPSTRRQAKMYYDDYIVFDLLTKKDVDEIFEPVFKKFGKKGIYRYTGSKCWVRLVNLDDFYFCLKKAFDLK